MRGDHDAKPPDRREWVLVLLIGVAVPLAVAAVIAWRMW